jgi:hypothetical protein
MRVPGARNDDQDRVDQDPDDGRAAATASLPLRSGRRALVIRVFIAAILIAITCSRYSHNP